MTVRANIRIKILKALRAADGEPVPEFNLHNAALAYTNGAGPEDVKAELSDLRASGHVAGEHDMIGGITLFTLTIKGEIAAKQL